MPWGSLIGAGGAIAGGLFGARQGRKDSRIANQRFQQGVAGYDQGIQAFNQKFAQGEPFIQQLLQTAMASLQEQRALSSDIGQYGYLRISDALSRGTGQITRNFASRGLAGSSAQFNAQRGLQSDIGRGFADLTSQLAGVRSQTVRAALGDLMNAQQAAAGYYQQGGSTLGALHSQRAGGILGVGHQPAQGIGAGWGTAASFLGRALDEFIGTPGTGQPPNSTGLLPGDPGPPLPPGFNT